MPREHRELVEAERQLVRNARKDELGDDQRDHDPVQALREDSPSRSGVSEGHVIKLKRVTATCKLRLVAAAILVGALAGCPSTPPQPESTAPSTSVQPVAHEGRPFAISGEESLLLVLVYRGGALARVGHNHVVASHNLSGTAWVADDLTRSSFEVHVPVNDLMVDETQLRLQEGPEFPRRFPKPRSRERAPTC